MTKVRLGNLCLAAAVAGVILCAVLMRAFYMPYSGFWRTVLYNILIFSWAVSVWWRILHAQTRRCLLGAAALMLFWPSSNTLPNTLRAASDTVFPTVLSLCVLWLVTIALGYFLSIPAGLGLWGVWIATWISWAIRDVGFFIRFHGRKWLYKSSLKLS